MTTTQATTGSGTFEVVNPATGEVTGSYPVHAAAEVAAAVAQAREAQRWWEALGFGGRAALPAAVAALARAALRRGV